ncbi:MAG: ABC transporter substrate-binding protein [Nitrospinota bacterium]
MRKLSSLSGAAVILLGMALGADAAPPTLIRLAAAVNIGNMLFYAAVDKGFLARRGFDPKLELYATGAEMSKALDVGQVDFSVAAISNLPVALERGLTARAVSAFTGSAYVKTTDDEVMAIVVRPDSGINSLADLAGKTVGVTFGGTNELYLQEVLKKNSIPLSAVQRINVPLATPVGLFDTGGVHAMAMFEPQITMMLDKVKGARLLQRGGGFVCFCSSVHGLPDRVYKDRDATQRLVDALSETAFWLRDPKNLDEISVIASRYIRGLERDIVKRTFKYASFDPRLGKNTYIVFRKTVEQLIEQKKMKAPFDPEKYYDASFVKRTMERHPEWFKDLPAVKE